MLKNPLIFVRKSQSNSFSIVYKKVNKYFAPSIQSLSVKCAEKKRIAQDNEVTNNVECNLDLNINEINFHQKFNQSSKALKNTSALVGGRLQSFFIFLN
jgi:hypothetical protein